MANELSTHGVLLKYVVESTAGTRPTSGYTLIHNIKSIPDFNSEPETIEVTDLSETVAKRYIPGLKDVSSAIAFEANFTTQLKSEWAALMSAWQTGQSAVGGAKATWFEVVVPTFGSFFFSGTPSELGLPSIEVDSVFAGNVYITPNQIEGWGTSSTT